MPTGKEELPLQKFAAVEHQDVGNEAFYSFLEDEEALKDELFKEGLIDLENSTLFLYEASNNPAEPLLLTAGDYTALGGDFYGIAKEPISVRLEHPSYQLKSLPVEERMKRCLQRLIIPWLKSPSSVGKTGKPKRKN